jgi:hypothetical protein
MGAGKLPRVTGVARMSPVAVNEHLAKLLQVQGGLLDAYLEQNLGDRYAYTIIVWAPLRPTHPRAVTNVHRPRRVRAALREFSTKIAQADTREQAVELDRAPILVDLFTEEN